MFLLLACHFSEMLTISIQCHRGYIAPQRSLFQRASRHFVSDVPKSDPSRLYKLQYASPEQIAHLICSQILKPSWSAIESFFHIERTHRRGRNSNPFLLNRQNWRRRICSGSTDFGSKITMLYLVAAPTFPKSACWRRDWRAF